MAARTVKCPKCGFDFTASDTLTRCPRCTYEFSTEQRVPASYTAPAPAQAPAPWSLPPPPVPSRYVQRAKRSYKPSIAGILLIIAALLGFAFAGLIPQGLALLENPQQSMMRGQFMGEALTVHGTVTDEQGALLPNVTVELIGTGFITSTRANGTYSIKGVPMGIYKIKASRPNYTSVIVKAFIAQGAENNDFVLEEGAATVVEDHTQELFAVAYTCATVIVVFSVFALLGGIFALKRKRFGLAVVGAILGIPALGFFAGTLFSIIALLLLFLSKDEFK